MIGKKIIHRKNVENVDFFVEFVEKTVYFRRKMCYNIITISICVLRSFITICRDYYYKKQEVIGVIKKEMIAMLLAGGQGSRLGVLTSSIAKPAVAFGGKYRIIDFPLSNCINSGVDTVGVLTQYQPLRLNTHIGIGIPWDLDRNIGGVTVLPPYEKNANSEWYTGTANAIYQNIDYMESFNPEYVLILSGDHIYKMDYEVMLDFHKEKVLILPLRLCRFPWKKQNVSVS